MSASRSGIWTYYEATPVSTQERISEQLEAFADLQEIAPHYLLGMKTWKETGRIEQVDEWIDRNEPAIELTLLQLARSERKLIEAWNDSARS